MVWSHVFLWIALLKLLKSCASWLSFTLVWQAQPTMKSVTFMPSLLLLVKLQWFDVNAIHVLLQDFLVSCILGQHFQDGTSNCFKGLMLILCYLIVAASFYVYADPNIDGKASFSVWQRRSWLLFFLYSSLNKKISLKWARSTTQWFCIMYIWNFVLQVFSLQN